MPAHWMGVQEKEFRRLGVQGAWGERYATMDFPSEAAIAGEIGKFLLNGELFRGLRPVMWSPVEKTALAEAEIEYHDHTSTTIWVRFPVVTPSVPELAGAIGGDLDHHALDHAGQPRHRLRGGVRLRGGAGRLRCRRGLARPARRGAGGGAGAAAADLRGGRRRNPPCAARAEGRRPSPARSAPIRCAAAATTTTCRCCSAISSPPRPAPASSTSPPATARRISTSAARTASRCRKRWAMTAPSTPGCRCSPGMHVYKAADPVCAAMTEAGGLLARGKLVHSYPHSWRSKAPLIFRATPQWFIRMDGAAPHPREGAARPSPRPISCRRRAAPGWPA